MSRRVTFRAREISRTIFKSGNAGDLVPPRAQFEKCVASDEWREKERWKLLCYNAATSHSPRVFHHDVHDDTSSARFRDSSTPLLHGRPLVTRLLHPSSLRLRDGVTHSLRLLFEWTLFLCAHTMVEFYARTKRKK